MLCSIQNLKYNFSQIPDWCVSEDQPVPLNITTFHIIPSKRAEQSASRARVYLRRGFDSLLRGQNTATYMC